MLASFSSIYEMATESFESPKPALACKDIPYFSLAGRVFENARITKVYDGDTVTFAAPIGPGGDLRRIRTRLLGVDACHITGPDGHKGRSARRDLVDALGIPVDPEDKYGESFFDQNVSHANVVCYDFDKYGRVLVELSPANSDAIVNAKLVESSKFFSEYGS